jgi:hypothetical protein
MIYLYSTVRSTRTVRTVQVRTSAASAVTALHKKYSEVTALHKYVLRTCTELTVQVQVPASTYMYRTDCTSTGTFTTALRGADHKTNRVADLLWELNFIVTTILKIALLGKTVVFNAAPDGLGRINGQNHLNRGFGHSRIAV